MKRIFPIQTARQQRRSRRHAARPYLAAIELLEARRLLASDFGDAPIPYATLLSENGAQHDDLGPVLGIHRDTETDGVHSPLADGDDMTGIPDDEDGVSFGAVRVGQLGASATVVVSNAPSGARLDAWIDFNGDGSWGGPLEQIANSVFVVNGNNTLSFDVPSTAADGTTFARFRLSTAGNLGMRGMASDGEVEDHAVFISPPAAASGVFGDQNEVFSDASGATSVFAADVDGDGDTDLLSAWFGDDKIGWYENNGSQNFTERIIRIGGGPESVSAADVDGDGDTDILFTLNSDDKIGWYENDGSQNFIERTISIAANGARSVFAADMDGDGDTDILSASAFDDKIAWYENDGSQNFTERVISTAADYAQSVFAADVDGDGDTDVLSASRNDDKIAWYANDGSQNFTEQIISAAADGAYFVFAADVDGDGNTDVLSASRNDDKIAWYENDGSQNFTERIISTAADGAKSVFAADVDGDGDTDVLSASEEDDKIAWYENDGSQDFTEWIISTAADNAQSVFAADVDGDGDTDVLSASRYDDKIAWYENLPDQPDIDVWGNGSSVPDGDTTPSLANHTNFGATLVTAGTLSRTFTIVNAGGLNLNLTGSPRVVVSGIHESDFTVTVQPSSPVAPGNGTTTFTVVFDPSGSGTRSGTVSIANDDVDEDPYDFAIAGGGLDLPAEFGDAPAPYPTTLAENGAGHGASGPTLGSHRDTETDGVHSLLADGDDTTGIPDDEDGVSFESMRVGQLGASATVVVANAPSGARLDAWIDFNGDGSWGGPLEQIANSVFVVNGNNTLSFDVPSTAAGGTTFARFRLSTDGHLGVRGLASDGEVEDHAVTINPPAAASGVFGGEEIISTAAKDAFSVFAADVDGDGDTDVLSAGRDDESIAWYENDGSQSFTERIISAPDDAWSVFAADVDGDGDIDVLSAGDPHDTDAGDIAWYENDGAQNFTVRIISNAADGARSVFAADVDGDGDTDVLSASAGEDKIAWYENNGNQNFTEQIISTNADGAWSVFAADVDGDGDTDVLSASDLDDKIAWYENDGSQNFTEQIISTAADTASSVFAADVDGDGDTDVLSASADDDKIAWYENDGSQNFAERVISTAADGARSVFAVDVDGDGDTDVLSASHDDDKIAWYENDGSQNFTERVVSTVANGARSVFAADVDGDGDSDVLSASWRDDKIAWYENLPAVTGDFNGDGVYDVVDIDALVTVIAAGSHDDAFDMTGDGLVDLADRDAWLATAGAINLPSGNPYLLGDSTLDGVVDGQDFIRWNGSKFTSTGKWSQADWNADGITDGLDFIIWNGNKFQSSDATDRPVLLSSQSLPIPQPSIRRIDAVFASLHRREHTQARHVRTAFDDLDDNLPKNSWVL